MIGWILAGVAVPTAATALFLSQEKFGALPEGRRLERILRSPHQKDGRFRNLEETPQLAPGRSMAGVAWEFAFGSHPGRTPEDSIPAEHHDLRELGRDRDLVVWFGHSSYLLQVGGLRVLVDPIFSGRASPLPFGTGAFRGSDRYRVEDLPEIDLLVITHDHWDHLDWETVKALKPKVARVACGLGVGAHLERWGYDTAKIVELDWEERLELRSGASLTAVPARHFSGRGLRPDRSLWCAYVLQAQGRRIFLGGDGGYGAHMTEIGKVYGPFDLAILEQGQYDSAWPFIHMLPSQLAPAMSDLRAARLMPVHNSKFCLSNHPWDEPLRGLEAAAERGGFGLLTPRIGQVVDLSDSSGTDRWWEPGKAQAANR